MALRSLRSWLVLVGAYASGCALTGYDFGDYQGAAPSRNAAGEPSTTTETTYASFAGGAATEGGAGAPASSGGAKSVSGLATDGGASGEAGQAGQAGGCEPRGCFEQSVQCGVATDGCGRALDCGGCLWWFLECRQNHCQFVE